MDEQGYQAKERCKAVVAVYLIVFDLNKGILLARRCNTGYEDGKYNFPSGHVEENELPTEALVRETKEELGEAMGKDLILYPPALRHVGYRPKHDQTGNRIDLYFEQATTTGFEIVINGEPDKCDHLLWVRANEFPPENFVPHNRIVFDKLYREKGKGVSKYYSELSLGWLREHGQYKL